MTPLKVKAFLERNKRVSVRDVAHQFAIDLSLAEALLRFWVVRGMCSRVHSCQECPYVCESRLHYEWHTSHTV